MKEDLLVCTLQYWGLPLGRPMAAAAAAAVVVAGVTATAGALTILGMRILLEREGEPGGAKLMNHDGHYCCTATTIGST